MDVDFEYDESIELSYFPTQSELNDLIRQMKKINIRRKKKKVCESKTCRSNDVN